MCSLIFEQVFPVLLNLSWTRTLLRIKDNILPRFLTFYSPLVSLVSTKLIKRSRTISSKVGYHTLDHSSNITAYYRLSV